jgi:hypothetical protein
MGSGFYLFHPRLSIRPGLQNAEHFFAIAKSLPKSYIKAVLAKMRPNLKALVDAHGYTPKND